MQKITFSTSAGTVIADDVNVSSLGGERIFRLNDFDGNSVKTRVNAYQCIGMPGQRSYSAVPDVKTITASLSFAPVYLRNNRIVCTGSAGMYALRREVLRRFPPGENGTLTYTNDAGRTYTITARIDEMPVIKVHDGWLCECTILFTADYPYWCEIIESDARNVTGTEYFTPPSYGDIPSPIGGTITCTSPISSGEIAYSVINTDDVTRRIDFCESLSAGDVLDFSIGYNNKWVVTKNGSRAPHAIYYVDFSLPCMSFPSYSSFKFELGRGSANVRLRYYNLFTAI